MLLIYNAAALNGAAFAGKLKKLEHYTKKPVQSPREMLTMLQALKSNGANMTIRRVAA